MAAGRGGGEGIRTRDHLANTRNLLAWCRLGAALMAVGYSMDKLGLLENLGGTGWLGSRYVSLTAVMTGVGVVAAACLRFVRQRAAIETSEFRPSYRADIAIAGLAAAGGVVAMIQLVMTR
jgi:uncharacterized membrane protein YidH (DUF202 family)